MVITVDKANSVPIYLQIRAQIVAAIAQQQLFPGESLPSVRALARDLGVNMHTVNKAYAVLQDEGYVVMSGRNGTLIADPSMRRQTAQSEEANARLYDALAHLALEHYAQGGTSESFLALARKAAQSEIGPEKGASHA